MSLRTPRLIRARLAYTSHAVHGLHIAPTTGGLA